MLLLPHEYQLDFNWTVIERKNIYNSLIRYIEGNNSAAAEMETASKSNSFMWILLLKWAGEIAKWNGLSLCIFSLVWSNGPIRMWTKTTQLPSNVIVCVHYLPPTLSNSPTQGHVKWGNRCRLRRKWSKQNTKPKLLTLLWHIPMNHKFCSHPRTKIVLVVKKKTAKTATKK